MYYNKYNILTRKIDDLEMTVLSCLLCNPENMKDPRLKDELFVNHQKEWQFMKAVYKKFGCFDLALMYNNVRNRYNYMGFIIQLLDIEVIGGNFTHYIDELIHIKHQDEIERYRANIIFSMAHDLIEHNITCEEFKQKIDKLFEENENE